VPRQTPDLELGASLYQASCVSCHGASGDGRGIAAAGLEPSPTDFTDSQRQSLRTLYGLYGTITLGVDETAMAAYGGLSDHERWSLAFYVGQLAGDGAQHHLEGEAWHDLQWLATTAPQEAASEFGAQGAAQLLYLRANPGRVFSEKPAPLVVAHTELVNALDAYQNQDYDAARRYALSAYLEGFELAEAAVRTTSPKLVRQVETEMTALRGLIKSRAPVAEVSVKVAELQQLFDEAQDRLRERKLTGGAAFTSSLIILLREGLEAILVVAALAAFLIKTGRRDAMRYLHVGWIGALLAGFATWYLATYVIKIGGAQREITEGFAALIAAGVLFYVGFWLHSKTPAEQWQKFIRVSVNKALSAPTLWALAGLSFISVYREAFETILFYQAIWAQAQGDGQSMIMLGFGAAAFVLLVVGWGMVRYGLQLPLRQFFAVTGVFLFVLAMVFAGKGIVAMQEAGWFPVTPLNFNAVEILGLYPNLQGVITQLVMLALAGWLLFRSGSRRTQAAG
jgi:high-affinity iron transporter